MRLLFQLSRDCVPFVGLLKKVFAKTSTYVAVNSSNITTVLEVVMRAKEKKCEAVLTSDVTLLRLLVENPKATIDDYSGSLIIRRGIEFLIMPPVKHLVTVPYGSFLYDRYLSKLLSPEKWMKLPDFTWDVFYPEHTDFWIDTFSSCNFIATDIETGREEDKIITCVGFTAITLSKEFGIQAKTVVVPFTDEYNRAFIATINALEQPKCFQNGKYDNLYFLRFGVPVYNYAFDTINLFHSWLSELPKDLGFISTFTLRDWEYWKNERKTNDIMEYYRYNAKDAFATAMSWLSLIMEVPKYAWDNYLQEFPVVFPCLLAEATGLRRDNELMKKAEEKALLSLEVKLKKLQTMVGNPNFNPSSPPQVLRLFHTLGSEDVANTGPASRDKVADRHPINKRIVTEITSYRKERKLFTTYYRDEIPKKEGRTKSWFSRIFYALNPHATDTGRLASQESAFWCGWNIQNIPYGVKEGIVADEGFYLAEIDYAQNEARGTAYLSGDKNLIAAVDDKTKDFHGTNASKFFGVPYEQIVNSYLSEEDAEWIHSTIDKALRDLSKRTNHGANYNMGPQVMLDTMGIENVRRAKKLLSLPENWNLLRVTDYLLEMYAKAYPIVKGPWYDKCINDVVGKGYLVGPTGWTRKCFGNPKANKHWLNAYVAHPPQSLAAMQLNKVCVRIFHEIAIPEALKGNYKGGPQIHDANLFQYRIGREDIVWQIADRMRLPTEVTDTFGVKRTLIVPTDVKGGATRWSELKALRRPKDFKIAA